MIEEIKNLNQVKPKKPKLKPKPKTSFLPFSDQKLNRILVVDLVHSQVMQL